ncbi:MAG: helix-turn-helix transcriptional regulator [bacterium]|nr:helix-turn-helix transcriptional regulator [bacterium]
MTMTTGPIVKQLRKNAGLTQSGLADQIAGYDAGNLSRFERGIQGIENDKLAAIAAVLKTTLANIYALAEPNHLGDASKNTPVVSQSAEEPGSYRVAPAELPEFRASALRRIISNFGDGTMKLQKTIGESINIPPGQMQAKVHGDSAITGAEATKIEEIFKLRRGWMDEDHLLSKYEILLEKIPADRRTEADNFVVRILEICATSPMPNGFARELEERFRKLLPIQAINIDFITPR